MKALFPVPAPEPAPRLDYALVRAHSLALAAPLSAEDCAVQSMPDASPVKWHLAHTSWFFETLVLAKQPGYRTFDPAFAYLFNSYYEGLGPRHPRPRRGLLTRPAMDRVLAYRDHVDAAMTALLDKLAADDPLHETIQLGLNHEQQHQELILTDICHAFFCNPTLPVYADAALRAEIGLSAMRNPETDWLAHPGGIVPVGHDSDDFAFDNEGPRHPVLLQPFRMAARPVTNGEYRVFMKDGGYRRPEFWLSDGWARVEAEGWSAPLYWLEDDDGTTRLFGLGGIGEIDDAAPVMHVSFFEAAAFAAWAGKRLPSEFEWEAAATASGERLLHGQVWEWTRSSYDPYPGFRPFAGAAGEYNGKFMVGQMVLRGGSFATPPGHLRPTYRNFFPPHARWQFSGIRLAEDI
jgi:ergothioneine biosynthesis protein EgtB